MARTTVLAVQKILGDNYGKVKVDSVDVNSPDLISFIDTATTIVDRVSACAIKRGIPLTTSELELIERWLAAHYYVRMDALEQGGGTEGSSTSYVTPTMGDAERYKQSAMEVDYSGCLRRILAGSRARALWLGKAPSAQVPYSDRD